jgi:hypothetical protein
MSFFCQRSSFINQSSNLQSTSKYSIRPSSSGIVEDRTMVPGMASSLFIMYEYMVFPVSKFTRNEIGIIDEKRTRNLIKWICQVPRNPLSATMMNERVKVHIARI